VSVYHLGLRHFPRNTTRFNLGGVEIGAIALPWVQEKFIELEDEKWSPHEATLTIIEGPLIPIEGISMGRGWRTALREGEDVTERVLAEARQALSDGTVTPTPPPGHNGPPVFAQEPAVESTERPVEPPADPLALGVELAGLLGPEAPALLGAWREVVARSSGLAPSESLALAERELRSAGGRND
jgi:hypothetical protein